MDLQLLTNSAISTTVSPNVRVTFYSSKGYVIGEGRAQIPIYADPVTLPANIQALDGAELQHIDGLNIQGVLRAIYLKIEALGTVRPKEIGGDKLVIGTETWIIVKILETWPLWTKAVIVLQENE